MSGAQKSITILGLGPVGRTFARELRASGAELVLWSRNPERARNLAEEGERVAPSSLEAIHGADVVLLCVADTALESLASELAHGGPREKGVALHTNGYLGREVLAPLAAKGWSTGKLHPLAPFPPDPKDHGGFSAKGRRPLLRGAWCVIDGDAGPPSALEEARAMVERLGANPLELAPGAPAGRYHAAASLLAGGLSALAALAEELAADSFTDAANLREAYMHLASATLANIQAVGPQAALTGPAARGAADLVQGHLASLGEGHPGRAAYRVLGETMVELALARGSIDEPAARAIRALLR